MAGESDEQSNLQRMIESAYKPRDPIPYTSPPIEAANQSDYEQCITPRALLGRLPYSADIAMRQLRRELEYDRIQAVAHQAIWKLGSDSGSLSNAILGNWVWWLAMPKADNDFWDTGYLDVHVPHTIHEFRVELNGHVRFYGVRFWPHSDALKIVEQTASAARGDLPTLPQLPEAEAKRVSTALLDIWGKNLTEKRAIELARGMCPENRVSRDPFLETFRAIRGDKRPGKQPLDGQ